MENLVFDLTKTYGSFRPMHAVNNGPAYKRHVNDQKRTNFAAYKAAHIPYARTHDAAFCGDYGSEHTVDITAIFPNFDLDPNDPASYDFACTDEYMEMILDAGTKPFFRLGQKIEHYVKKFGTIPPKDFHKWAVICEHIIRHMNEGWANGHHYDIEYWEIWNEPDLDPDDSTNKRTWGGTKAQFFDLYEITAKHLKACFPQYKIGGPALAGNESWAADFLAEMHHREVPMDFFSWHIYCTEPKAMTEKAERMRKLMDANGYTKAESILNEWNYVQGWVDDFVYSIEQIIGMKGAAFTMACMSAAQKSSIDMLMYYDARPSVFNGLFDFYTMRELKGYYPFLWFSQLMGLTEVRCETDKAPLYTLCGIDENGKATAIITYYTNDDSAEAKEVQIDFSRSVDFGRNTKCEIMILDSDHDATVAGVTDALTFTMARNSCILLREV